MANGYSAGDLLDFLNHAGDRGLIPVATAQALAVASRNIFGVLDDVEKADVGKVDLEAAIKRFTNKRAKDFNPSSLKEYGNRVRRAVELFLRWRENPANFSVKTRATKPAVKRERTAEASAPERASPTRPTDDAVTYRAASISAGGYETSVPVRPGVVVTITNVPGDLTKAEAERLAGFIRLLAVG